MFVLLTIAVTGITQDIEAQRVAAKSNILADAFLNPNLGIEVGLAPKWTLDITGQSRTTDAGNTGSFNLKPGTGSATGSRGTSWVPTCMADSIISEVSTDKSTSSVRMPAN